jgi:hypothetical protein
MEMHDAWFFIGVFVFIFLIWVATGGPMHAISFTGPKLALPDALGGGTYLSLPRAPYGVGGSNISLPGSSSGSGSLEGSGGSNVPSQTSLSGIPFGTLSPYRNIVSMSHYISGAGSLNPMNESIDISVSQNAGIPIDITGWKLVSDAGGTIAAIPRGTEIPTSGVVNASDNIILTPGTRATVISGRSPIGASFRENKCIGYFSSFQSFYPQLPQNCPTPSNELVSYYGPNYIRDTACIDYVDKVPRCQIMLSPPNSLSGACQSFMVQYLNYNGCVTAHRNDSDFLGDTWRIYLGRSSSMWRSRHEVVKLLDINGKTVDAFSY